MKLKTNMGFTNFGKGYIVKEFRLKDKDLFSEKRVVEVDVDDIYTYLSEYAYVPIQYLNYYGSEEALENWVLATDMYVPGTNYIQFKLYNRLCRSDPDGGVLHLVRIYRTREDAEESIKEFPRTYLRERKEQLEKDIKFFEEKFGEKFE